MNMSLEVQQVRNHSLILLELLLPVNWASFFLGLIAMVCNALVLFTIFNPRKLYQKTYFLFCGHLAVVDFFTGVAFAASSLRRVIVKYMNTGNVRSIADCLWDVAPNTFFITGSVMLTTVVSVDQFFSINSPIQYRSFGRSYVVVLPSVAWFYCLIEASILVGMVLKTESGVLVSLCSTNNVYSEAFDTWLFVSRLFFTCLSVVLGLLTLVSLRKALAKNKNTVNPGHADQPTNTDSHTSHSVSSGASDTDKPRTQQLIKTTITILLIAGATFATQVISAVGVWSVNTLLEKDDATNGRLLFRAVQLLKASMNFWLYMWRSTLFRKTFLTQYSTVKRHFSSTVLHS